MENHCFFNPPLGCLLENHALAGDEREKRQPILESKLKTGAPFHFSDLQPPPEETDHLFNIYVSSLQLAAGRPLQWIQETAPTAMRQIKIKHLASDLPEDHPD